MSGETGEAQLPSEDDLFDPAAARGSCLSLNAAGTRPAITVKTATGHTPVLLGGSRPYNAAAILRPIQGSDVFEL